MRWAVISARNWRSQGRTSPSSRAAPTSTRFGAKGLEIQSAKLGDFVVKAAAESDTAKVGPVDVVIVAVKAYDNATALPMLKPMIGADYGRC